MRSGDTSLQKENSRVIRFCLELSKQVGHARQVKFLRVESKDDSKGRSFRGEIVCYATANAFWEGGENAGRELIRPVFAVFACSDAEARPFQANLQCGNKAQLFSEYGHDDHKKWEFMRSAKYTYVQQKHPEGVFVQVYLHDLFRDDAAMVDPDEVKFILIPSKEWLAPGTPEVIAHLRRWSDSIEWKDRYTERPTDAELILIAQSCHLWAKQIATRTKLPIPNDARFFAQVLASCLLVGASTFSGETSGWKRGFGINGGFVGEGLELFGLSSGIATKVKHEDVAKIFAENVDQFFAMVNN